MSCDSKSLLVMHAQAHRCGTLRGVTFKHDVETVLDSPVRILCYKETPSLRTRLWRLGRANLAAALLIIDAYQPNRMRVALEMRASFRPKRIGSTTELVLGPTPSRNTIAVQLINLERRSYRVSLAGGRRPKIVMTSMHPPKMRLGLSGEVACVSRCDLWQGERRHYSGSLTPSDCVRHGIVPQPLRRKFRWHEQRD